MTTTIQSADSSSSSSSSSRSKMKQLLSKAGKISIIGGTARVLEGIEHGINWTLDKQYDIKSKIKQTIHYDEMMRPKDTTPDLKDPNHLWHEHCISETSKMTCSEFDAYIIKAAAQNGYADLLPLILLGRTTDERSAIVSAFTNGRCEADTVSKIPALKKTGHLPNNAFWILIRKALQARYNKRVVYAFWILYRCVFADGINITSDADGELMPWSFHGLPSPLECDSDDVERKRVAKHLAIYLGRQESTGIGQLNTFEKFSYIAKIIHNYFLIVQHEHARKKVPNPWQPFGQALMYIMNGFQCPIKRDAETLIYNAQRCKIAFEPAEAYEQACRRRMAVVLYLRMTYRDVDTAIYGTLTWVQAVHRVYTKDGNLMSQGMCPPSLATSLPLFTRSKLGLKKAAWDEFWIMDCVRAKERAQALEASDSGVWTLADIQEVFNSVFDES